MLTIRGLTTHYGNSQALFGVDLEIGAGEVATLTGRNGMGKTTTINSIMGIVPPSGGSIVFDGVELAGQPSFQIANLGIGLVPEGRQIFPNLSLWENLVATASNHLGNRRIPDHRVAWRDFPDPRGRNPRFQVHAIALGRDPGEG